jgi:hypothetical protein
MNGQADGLALFFFFFGLLLSAHLALFPFPLHFLRLLSSCRVAGKHCH